MLWSHNSKFFQLEKDNFSSPLDSFIDYLRYVYLLIVFSTNRFILILKHLNFTINVYTCLNNFLWSFGYEDNSLSFNVNRNCGLCPTPLQGGSKRILSNEHSKNGGWRINLFFSSSLSKKKVKIKYHWLYMPYTTRNWNYFLFKRIKTFPIELPPGNYVILTSIWLQIFFLKTSNFLSAISISYFGTSVLFEWYLPEHYKMFLKSRY